MSFVIINNLVRDKKKKKKRIPQNDTQDQYLHLSQKDNHSNIHSLL